MAENTEPTQNRWGLMLAEMGLLVAGMALLGTVLIPSHWTSLWMDREFSGWVVPVGNRLHHGLKLYGEHGHLPMPPGPFVLTAILYRGEGTWLDESLLNFIFQSLTLLVMYLGLSRLWRPPVPFLSTCAGMAFFFALPKTICYDASAQFFAACGAVLTLVYLQRAAAGRGSYILLIVAMGVVSALCVLFKQSTGGGLSLGVGLAVLCSSSLPWRQRLLHAAVYTSATVASFVGLSLAMAPWIEPRGMVEDVFLHGSEAKGGGRQLVENLLTYAYEAGQFAAWFGLVAIVLAGVFGCRPERAEGSQEEGPGPSFPLWLGYVAAVLVPVVLLTTALRVRRVLSLCEHVEHTGMVVMWFGLLVALLLACKAWWPARLSWVRSDQATRPLAGFVLILFASAVAHTLSVWWFRWTYDNNPLVVLVLAVLLGVALHGLPPGRLSPRWRVALQLGVCLAVQAVAWSCFARQLAVCQRCTSEWSEVAHLRGARLVPSAHGMRKLVQIVKEAAPDRERDRVLLLPNDPNVEAWIERQPPALSSVIVFADQYLDRRVEVDLETLRREPPRVIVIGPKDYWRGFHHNWNHGYGAERFIDTVQAAILPDLYQLHARIPISHNRKMDVMEVYVLKGTPP